jgi:hypothetical protein
LLASPLAAQRTHPTPENLALTPSATITKRDTASGDAALDRMAARLRALRPAVLLGGENATGGADFGRIGDVAVDSAGRILVLDLQDKGISRWSAAGAAAGKFGREGGGPLEFNFPTRLAIQRDGTLLVLDRALGIRRFRWERDPAYLDTWMPSQTGEALCTHGADAVMQRRGEDGSATQVVGPNGARARGIALGYQDPNELTRRLLSGGSTGCLPDGGYATTLLLIPVVRFWSATGVAGPITRIADFSPMGVTETDGGLTYRFPEEGYHAVRALTPIGPDLVLVQIFFQDATSSQERAEYKELQSYLVSARTGRGVYLGTSLPMVQPLPDGGFVGWRNDPVPEVVILR